MAQSRREQLQNFAPSYRAGYLSSGGPNLNLKDEEIIQKMEKHDAEIHNERDAEECGRKDGHEEREQAK